jgi:hypothetical protein
VQRLIRPRPPSPRLPGPQLLSLGTAAFKYLSQLTCCAAAGGAGGSLPLELSLLRAQRALLAALEALAGLRPADAAGRQAVESDSEAAASEKLAALRDNLSRAAGAALEETWASPVDPAAGEAPADATAKGAPGHASAALPSFLPSWLPSCLGKSPQSRPHALLPSFSCCCRCRP